MGGDDDIGSVVKIALAKKIGVITSLSRKIVRWSSEYRVRFFILNIYIIAVVS